MENHKSDLEMILYVPNQKPLLLFFFNHLLYHFLKSTHGKQNHNQITLSYKFTVRNTFTSAIRILISRWPANFSLNADQYGKPNNKQELAQWAWN